MNFVEAMLKAAPTRADLIAAGRSPRRAEISLGRYTCTKRSQPIKALKKLPDPLLQLMADWDLGKICVGMIELASEPTQDRLGNWIIGQDESNPLILCSNGEIIEKELGIDHILAVVCSSSENFLKALPLAAEFLGRRGVGQVVFGDLEAARAAARRCAVAAGGDRYYPYFSVLLGGED